MLSVLATIKKQNKTLSPITVKVPVQADLAQAELAVESVSMPEGSCGCKVSLLAWPRMGFIFSCINQDLFDSKSWKFIANVLSKSNKTPKHERGGQNYWLL